MAEKFEKTRPAEEVASAAEIMVFHRPTRILCCDAAAWVKAYAYFVIVTSLVGMIITIPAVFTYYYPPNIPEEYIQDKEDAWFIFNSVLAISVIALGTRLLLGFLLLRGTTRDITSLLYTWIVLLSIGFILTVLGGVLSIAAGNFPRFLQITSHSMLSAFMIYVIRLRIKDIDISRHTQTYVFLYPPQA